MQASGRISVAPAASFSHTEKSTTTLNLRYVCSLWQAVESPWPRHILTICACPVVSLVSDSVTLRPVAGQAPLSMAFSRQEYWGGLPCPSPGDLPNQGSNPGLTLPPGKSTCVPGRKPHTYWLLPSLGMDSLTPLIAPSLWGFLSVNCIAPPTPACSEAHSALDRGRVFQGSSRLSCPEMIGPQLQDTSGAKRPLLSSHSHPNPEAVLSSSTSSFEL